MKKRFIYLTIFLSIITLGCTLIPNNDNPNQDIQPTEYIVTFITNGGTSLNPISTNKILEIPITSKNGYALAGWYTNAQSPEETRVSFPFVPTSNTTLYAKWISSTIGLEFRPSSLYSGYAVSKGSADTTKPVVIPGFWLGLPVVEISDSGFDKCTYLTQIVLPDTIKGIGSYAFDECTMLSSINLPTSLIWIGNYSFRKSGLFSIDLPDSVKAINYGAFYSCFYLSEIKLSNALTYLGPWVIAFCTKIQSLALPDSLESLNEEVFCYSSLKEITLSNNLDVIPDNAFTNSRNLTSIHLPNRIKKIGSEAFAFTGIENLDFPNQLEEISDKAFFTNSIVFPEYLTLPDTIRIIGSFAFGENVKTTNLVLPENLQIIGNRAFEKWTKLQTVSIKSITPPILGTLNFDSSSLVSILVPHESLETYKSTPGWSAYSEKIIGM